VLSNIVSNVPAVLALKPFIIGLSDPRRAWLIVAMASTLAGNFTLVGSIANLIVVERARALGVTIGFWTYFRVGAPLTLPAWQHDRPDVLLADRGCRVVIVGTFGPQGILVGHDCAATTGSSGAPLLVATAGGHAIAGVQVKAALGRPLGVAVPAFTIPAP